MAYTVTNLLPGDISMSGFVLGKGGKRTVDFLTKAIVAAKAKGAVSISPDNGANSESQIVSAAGTPSVSFQLVDVGASFNQATLNANFATVAAEIQRMGRIAANNEARIGDLPIYQN